MNLPLINLSAEQLRRAAEIKEQIDSLERELEDLLGTESEPIGSGSGGPRRRTSAATIARMRAAQRARWAGIRGETAASPKPHKRKIRRSATVRARLSQIAKARWKKARAAGRTTL
jgi:hypothetical protein